MRLQQAALPGETLLGPATERLVRDAATTEPVESVDLGGSLGRVQAFRLVELGDRPTPATPARAPLVGRAEELATLRSAFDRVATERRSDVLTDPRRGRYRQDAADRASWCRHLATEATALYGRCVSYGEGATYLPLTEIVRQAVPKRPAETIASLLAGEEDAQLVARASDRAHRGSRRARHRRAKLSGRFAACSRGWRAGNRSSSCSKTSTGRSRRCSSWSSTSERGSRRRRCSCSVWPGRSSSRSDPAGATRETILLDPLSDGRGSHAGRRVGGRNRGLRRGPLADRRGRRRERALRRAAARLCDRGCRRRGARVGTAVDRGAARQPARPSRASERKRCPRAGGNRRQGLSPRPLFSSSHRRRSSRVSTADSGRSSTRASSTPCARRHSRRRRCVSTTCSSVTSPTPESRKSCGQTSTSATRPGSTNGARATSSSGTTSSRHTAIWRAPARRCSGSAACSLGRREACGRGDPRVEACGHTCDGQSSGPSRSTLAGRERRPSRAALRARDRATVAGRLPGRGDDPRPGDRRRLGERDRRVELRSRIELAHAHLFSESEPSADTCSSSPRRRSRSSKSSATTERSGAPGDTWASSEAGCRGDSPTGRRRPSARSSITVGRAGRHPDAWPSSPRPCATARRLFRRQSERCEELLRGSDRPRGESKRAVLHGRASRPLGEASTKGGGSSSRRPRRTKRSARSMRSRTTAGGSLGRIEMLAGDAGAAERASRRCCETFERVRDRGGAVEPDRRAGRRALRAGSLRGSGQLAPARREIGAGRRRERSALVAAGKAKLLARQRALRSQSEELAVEAARLAGETDALNDHAAVLLDAGRGAAPRRPARRGGGLRGAGDGSIRAQGQCRLDATLPGRC